MFEMGQHAVVQGIAGKSGQSIALLAMSMLLLDGIFLIQCPGIHLESSQSRMSFLSTTAVTLLVVRTEEISGGGVSFHVSLALSSFAVRRFKESFVITKKNVYGLQSAL